MITPSGQQLHLRRWISDTTWGLSEVREAARPWLAPIALTTVAGGFGPVGLLIVARRAIGGFEAGAGPGAIAIPLLLLVGGFAVLLLARVANGYVNGRVAEAVRVRLEGRLLAHACRLPALYFDDARNLDRLHRARADASAQPLALLQGLASILQGALLLGGVLIFLGRYSLWLPAILAACVLPGVLLWVRQALAAHGIRRSSTHWQRIAGFLGFVLTDRQSIPEVRVFRLAPVFLQRHQDLQRDLANRQRQIDVGDAVTGLGVGLLTLIGLLAIAWVLDALHGNGGLSLADVAVVSSGLVMASWVAQAFVDTGGRFFRAGRFLGDLREFLAEPPVPVPAGALPAPARLRTGIEIRALEFGYPNGDGLVLRNLSLTFPANRISAIVGPSGSGKSTLLRLLCGLYSPTRGEILVDGVPFERLDPQEWRSRLGVLFQEPMRFPASVEENVGYGNACDPAGLRRAIETAGADEFVDRLPQKGQTMLGKAFGGTDLSGGQWQRVALARAYARDAAVVLLDEPTSALDPWSERLWFERFRERAQGRTAIVVTHRFTTAMRADLIHVLHEGRLVEAGTHDELLASGGLYAAGWREQLGGSESA